MLINLFGFITILLFILFLFFLFFFIYSFLKDIFVDFSKFKIRFDIPKHDTTTNFRIELRYFVWEKKKRQFYINYLEENKELRLGEKLEFKWKVYYKDVSPFSYGSKSSLIYKSIRIYT